jgi:hypothetical protein
MWTTTEAALKIGKLKISRKTLDLDLSAFSWLNMFWSPMSKYLLENGVPQRPSLSARY